ncbi:hypothetical protein ACFOZ0_30110 [Streptomyces yaanensis]|uniref:Uncharacterized protein n=1 Tax=Streptomyces yaanensis TaxID=1142239 RepID=A0ABV7SKC0_9ACTN|nr:hypothetical protein [Streptomyces sp. CGMCC 4.7035]WNC00414.1 hypothetical protein Q2K21_21420 [Streptomyces sp. CGMCC 4.7035]
MHGIQGMGGPPSHLGGVDADERARALTELAVDEHGVHVPGPV